MTEAFWKILMRPRSQYALDAAAVLCGLIVKGGQLGELERRPLVDAGGEPLLGEDGLQRVDKVPPRGWFDRIARAVEVGAFERMSVDQVVDHILTRPDGSAET